MMTVLAWPALLSARSQAYKFSDQNGKNQILFYSKASLEDFEGTAASFSGTARIDFKKPNLDLSGGVTVVVASLQTGLAMRDTHMRSQDWLDADHYPTLQFELKSSGVQLVVKKNADEFRATSEGLFQLKNKQKLIRVPITIQKKGDTILVSGDFTVPIEDFGIHGPPAMKILGLRVSPNVQVRFKLVGKK